MSINVRWTKSTKPAVKRSIFGDAAEEDVADKQGKKAKTSGLPTDHRRETKRKLQALVASSALSADDIADSLDVDGPDTPDPTSTVSTPRQSLNDNTGSTNFSATKTDPRSGHVKPSANGDVERSMDHEAHNVEDDDYMKMDVTVQEGHPPETSLQRIRRRQKEALARSQTKSSAELAAEAEEAREQAHSQSLFALPGAGKRKGVQLMAKLGYQGGALGVDNLSRDGSVDKDGDKNRDADRNKIAVDSPGTDKPDHGGSRESKTDQRTERNRSTMGENTTTGYHSSEVTMDKTRDKAMTEPIQVSIKLDRGGLGHSTQSHTKPSQYQKVDRREVDPQAYREGMARSQHTKRQERLVVAAQRVAMDKEVQAEQEARDQRVRDHVSQPTATQWGSASGDSFRKRTLAEVNVLWRGLARQTGLYRDHGDDELEPDLPEYADAEQEREDSIALGLDPERLPRLDKTGRVGMSEGKGEKDEDGRDEEERAFDMLPVDIRLQKVVQFLREEYQYCFWCKHHYEDASMTGCPGWTEEDHDD